MATTIDEISEVPEAGHRGADTRDDFVSTQEIYQDYQRTDLQPELNTSIGQINTVAGEIETNATTASDAATEAADSATEAADSATIALNASNYKGDWVGSYETTGYSQGMSVSYTDGFKYVSKLDTNIF